MEWFLPSLVVVLLAAIAVFYRQVTVMEYESGLLYSAGKFKRMLAPGKHGYLRGWHSIQKLDMRNRFVTVPGQELLTADNISLKISLAASFKVGDPYQAVHESDNFQEALYMLLQVNLRDIIGGKMVDEVLEKRQEIGLELLKRSSDQAKALGIILGFVNIKDVMFPGELKSIFAQVVKARKDGQAALERARGESAALRNLANASKLLQHNPELAHLRLLQTLENHGGSTVVLLTGSEGVSTVEALKKHVKSEAK
jgi:regulator of protease activity HflC (stomatin/prohibitin superfamily)